METIAEMDKVFVVSWYLRVDSTFSQENLHQRLNETFREFN